MNVHRQFLATYEGIRHRYLTHPECPLPAEAAGEIIRKRKRELMRLIMAHAFRFRFGYVAANFKALSYYIGK
jgi:hypothetical protein